MKRKFNIGLLVKQKRTRLGLTQKEVTDKMGWETPQFISNIERGVSQPPLKSAPKLCNILNISAYAMHGAYIKDFNKEFHKAFGIK